MNTVINNLNTIYSGYKSNLKLDSFDKEHNHYLVNDCIDSYCFDKFVLNEFPNSTPCSVDSLYIGSNNKLYLIEFKNQSNVNHTNIRLKIHESLLILFGKLNLSYQYLNNNNMEIIIVHKPAGNYKMYRHNEKKNNPSTNPLRPYKKALALTDNFNVSVYICDSEELINYLN